MNFPQICRHLLSPVVSNNIFRGGAFRTFCDAAAVGFVPLVSKLPPRLSTRVKQNYDFFLVLDFEATCDSPVTVVPQEAIEFPVLKLNGQTFDIESVFHSFVRPTINPQLTKFCTELTGINQQLVDSQPVFEDVYENFQRWMEKENLLSENTQFAFATCGDWDLKFLFPSQCKGHRIPVPKYLTRWINVKVTFAEVSGVYPRNMSNMLKHCGLELEGRLHSGIDDCKNIANIMRDLAARGIVFEPNARTS